jgi:DNA repair exonuclease SbcCD ATPase subunit
MPESRSAADAPSPRSAEHEIFPSPRIADRKAFIDIGRALKELVRRAEVGAENLRTAAAEAERAREGLRESGAAQQLKIDLTAKALTAVDQRTDQARKLLDGAAMAVSRLDGARQEADRAIENRLAILAARLDEAERATEPRVSAFQSRLAQAIADAQQRVEGIGGAAVARVSAAIQTLSALVNRAESLAAPTSVGSLADLIGRAEQLQGAAASAVACLESVRQGADQAACALSASLSAAAPKVAEASAARAALDSAVAELIPQSASAAAELRATITAATQAREATSAAATAARDACDRIATLLAAIEPWHALLLDQRAGAALPPQIREVVDAVRIDLRRDLAAVAGALHAIADRTSAALDG